MPRPKAEALFLYACCFECFLIVFGFLFCSCGYCLNCFGMLAMLTRSPRSCASSNRQTVGKSLVATFAAISRVMPSSLIATGIVAIFSAWARHIGAQFCFWLCCPIPPGSFHFRFFTAGGLYGRLWDASGRLRDTSRTSPDCDFDILRLSLAVCLPVGQCVCLPFQLPGTVSFTFFPN